MPAISVEIGRVGAQNRETTSNWTRLSVADALGLGSDGADLTLAGDWTDAEDVVVRIAEDGNPSAFVRSVTRVLSATASVDVDGFATTRIRAGRVNTDANAARYAVAVRGLITEFELAALSPEHLAWAGYFAGVETGLAATILQDLDTNESTLSEYVGALSEWSIEVDYDSPLPTQGETEAARRTPTLYAAHRAVGADLTLALNDFVEWRRDYDRYENPLGAYSTAPVEYLVGAELQEDGSGNGDPADLGEWQYAAQGRARTAAYRQGRRLSSVTAAYAFSDFNAALRPRAGVIITGGTPAALARWRVQSVTLSADADGGFKTALSLAGIQK